MRLRRALSLNPEMKLLIAHGYFDLATPYFASKYLVERLELDLPDGAIPSLSQRFAAKTGMDPAQLLSVPVELGGRE